MNKIYQFKNVPFQKLVDEYINKFATSNHTINKVCLLNKFAFLSNLIIDSSAFNKDSQTKLLSTRLGKVLGYDIYKKMLVILENLELIKINNNYVQGSSCNTITLLTDSEISHYCSTKKFEELNKKWNENLEKDIERYNWAHTHKFLFSHQDDGKVELKQVVLDTPDETKLYSQYNKVLKKLKFRITKKEAKEYLTTHFSHLPDSKIDRMCAKVDNFKKSQNTIRHDQQNRIYHYLTNCDSELRPLFNISHELDVANMHPLLLSYRVIRFFKIPDTILEEIYNFDVDNYINNPCSIINDANKNIPADVIHYIYICNKGIFWDEFAKLSGIPRKKAKVKMFSNVFYGPNRSTKYSELGQKFKELFPTVYEILFSLKHKAEKNNNSLIIYRSGIDNLPKQMMVLESNIMYEILKRCYAKKWDVINIHDAIIIMDTRNKPTPEDVKEVMMQVFKEIHLAPTIHYEEFSIGNA